MSPEFCRDVPDPCGGCSKVCAEKVRAHFSFPKVPQSSAESLGFCRKVLQNVWYSKKFVEEIRSGPGKPNQRKVSSWTFRRGIPEQKFKNVNRACFPKEKHQNSHKNGRNSWTFHFGPFFLVWFAGATPEERVWRTPRFCRTLGAKAQGQIFRPCKFLGARLTTKIASDCECDGLVRSDANRREPRFKTSKVSSHPGSSCKCNPQDQLGLRISFGARLRGRTATQRFKEGFWEGSGFRVLGKGFWGGGPFSMGFTVRKGSEKGFWESNFQKVPRTPPWGVRPLSRAP